MVDAGPGILYEWSDMDFIGAGDIEENTLTESVICRVDVSAEIIEGLDEFERYRITQEEYCRVSVELNESSSSSDTSSSSGVEDDMQIDSLRVSVHFSNPRVRF
jgi:hypothetical protein